MKHTPQIHVETRNGEWAMMKDDGQTLFLIGDNRRLIPTSWDAARLALAWNHFDQLVRALEDLTKEVHLGKLNIRKDFSLINAHACALKALHAVKEGQ